MEKYCIVSKEPSIVDRGVDGGLHCLISFAQLPLWKTFKYLYLQKDTLGWWDKVIAEYALKKYANQEGYHIIPLEEAQAKFNEYIKQNYDKQTIDSHYQKR